MTTETHNKEEKEEKGKTLTAEQKQSDLDEDEEFTVVDVTSALDTSDTTGSVPSSPHTDDTILIHHNETEEPAHGEKEEELNDSDNNSGQPDTVLIHHNETEEAARGGREEELNDSDNTSGQPEKVKETKEQQERSTATSTSLLISSPPADIMTETTNVWKDNTASPALTTPTLTVTEDTSDPWKEEEEEKIHHKQEIGNNDDRDISADTEKTVEHWNESIEASPTSITATTPIAIASPTAVVQPPLPKSVSAVSPPTLDTETSHRKGFQNGIDMDQIVDLEVSGRLPDWLIGEHYTIGPGIYDVKYLRKVEIDGEIQHASSYFTFGHWFDALPLVNRFDLNGAHNTISYRNKLPNRRLIEKIRDHHGYTPPHPASVFKTNSNQSVLSKFMKSNVKPSKPDAEICGARVLPNIPGIVGRLFAQNSAKHIQELDPFDLKPTRVFTWDEINPRFKGYSSCPNGKFDTLTGEYINFTMEVGYQSSQYHFFSISDRDPQGSIIATITAPTAYVNSFSITPKYIIFAIFPMIANSGGMKFSWNESILDSFSFARNESTMFYVISREKRQVAAVFRTASCFAFHHINAFEDLEQRGSNIYVDMICYTDDTIAHQLATGSLRHPETMNPRRLAASEVRRYALINIEEEHLAYLANQSSLPGNNSSGSAMNLPGRFSSVLGNMFRGNNSNKKQSIPNATASTSFGTASDHGNDGRYSTYSWMPMASYDLLVQPSLELPQINPNYNMHKYRYMYSLGFSAASSIMDGQVWDSIVKTNVDTKSIVASWYKEHCYPSEAIFIPRPMTTSDNKNDQQYHQQQEDEGVLVSVVMDSARATSFLLILDAITLHVLATADLGTLVPISFAHGTYRLRN